VVVVIGEHLPRVVRERTSHTVRLRTSEDKGGADKGYTVTTVTTVRHQQRAEAAAEAVDFRQRLLDAMAASIVEDGYRNTTVADIVRRARTSRRTFYEHFSDKETCFVALLTDNNAQMIREISAAVDAGAPWTRQVRQAVEAWIAFVESQPPITLSWIRDVPSLGAAARRLQRDTMEAFITMIQTLCGTEAWRAVRAGPVPRQLAVMLLGGLRELTATTVEDGGRISDITELAVQACTVLLGPLPE
jgi:AcrR family transcriptional regulator